MKGIEGEVLEFPDVLDPRSAPGEDRGRVAACLLLESTRPEETLELQPKPRTALLRVALPGRLARIHALAVVSAIVVFVACGEGPAERIDTIYALKGDPTPEHVESIRAYLDDPDPQVRVTAMYQLVELDVPDARELALEGAADPAPFVRKMAAQQLERFGDEGVARVLAARATEDDDDRVRRQAALSLTEIGGPVAADALGACLTDPVADVRRACTEGVAKVDPGPHVETLVRLLGEDPEWEVRVQAARALGLAGDRDALPALTAATEDVHEYVRAAAAHAIERVREAPGPPAEPALDEDPAAS